MTNLYERKQPIIVQGIQFDNNIEEIEEFLVGTVCEYYVIDENELLVNGRYVSPYEYIIINEDGTITIMGEMCLLEDYKRIY